MAQEAMAHGSYCRGTLSGEEANRCHDSLHVSSIDRFRIAPAVKAAFEGGYEASALAMLDQFDSKRNEKDRISVIEQVAKRSVGNQAVAQRIVPLLRTAAQELLPLVESGTSYKSYDAMANMLIALAAAGDWPTALRYADTLPQDRVYVEIANALIRAGRLQEARDALVTAWRLTDKKSGPLVAIAKLSVLAGDLRGARFIADDFDSSFHESSESVFRRYDILCSIFEAGIPANSR